VRRSKFTFAATLITNFSAINYSIMGKIWCYRKPSYFSSGFITFWRQKNPELMKGLGSGIKEFKTFKEDQPADKKMLLKSKFLTIILKQIKLFVR
jgi:hypothetical protein